MSWPEEGGHSIVSAKSVEEGEWESGSTVSVKCGRSKYKGTVIFFGK